MSDEAAFLATIIANPDDDLPRLVFADWLDENGDPDRAEFIRLQIRQSRTPGLDGPHPVNHRIHQLSDANRQRWLVGFSKGFRENARAWRFRRGFLEDLPISAAGFVRLTKKVWARHPIQELDLSEVRGRLDAVFAKPEMNRIRELTFHASYAGEEPTDTDLEALAATPNLTGLRRLAVWTRNGNPVPEALARCPSLRGLQSLSLSDERMEAAGFRVLTRDGADNLRNLKRLRLDLRRHGSAVAEAVGTAAALTGLEELFFPGDHSQNDGRVHDRGAVALARSPHLANLRRLSLHRQVIGPTGAVALGRSPRLANLRALHLEGNEIGVRGARAVATGPWVGLTTLELDFCELGDAEVIALAERGTPTALTELVLHHNDIGPDGAVALGRAKWLGRLEKLNLEGNPIGDEGALALCRSEVFAGVKELRVGSRYRDYFSADALKALKKRFGKDVHP